MVKKRLERSDVYIVIQITRQKAGLLDPLILRQFIKFYYNQFPIFLGGRNIQSLCQFTHLIIKFQFFSKLRRNRTQDTTEV